MVGMDFELPPNWIADHDQLEAELREFVRPVVNSMIQVRIDSDRATEMGEQLATDLARRISAIDPIRLTELFFLSLTKIAHTALDRYDERLERALEQVLEHARGEHDAGGDAGGAEERSGSGAEPAAEAGGAEASPQIFEGGGQDG